MTNTDDGNAVQERARRILASDLVRHWALAQARFALWRERVDALYRTAGEHVPEGPEWDDLSEGYRQASYEEGALRLAMKHAGSSLRLNGDKFSSGATSPVKSDLEDLFGRGDEPAPS